MPIITETLSGDDLFCLQEFNGCPQGELFTEDTCHRFSIGERVRFESWYQDDNIMDNPAGWMVVFETDDGKRFAATQTYFATEDCWKGLTKHFHSKPNAAAPVKKKKAVSGASAKKKKTNKSRK